MLAERRQRCADADAPGRHHQSARRAISTPAPTSSQPTPSRATPISQAEYALEEVGVRDERRRRARWRARRAIKFEAADGKPRAVAGAVGPTTKLLSMSPEVGDPGRRDSDFDDMAERLQRANRGLIEGGADLLLIETITDTLNAKSGAVGRVGSVRRNRRRAAALDQRHHHRSIGPHAVGANRGGVLQFAAPRQAVGDRSELRARPRRHARVPGRSRARRRMRGERLSERGLAQRHGRLRRNAAFDGSALCASGRKAGLLNIAGGCCGTTPEHISHMKHAVEGVKPRAVSPAHDRAAAPVPASNRSRRRHDDPPIPSPISSSSVSAPTSPARRNFAS